MKQRFFFSFPFLLLLMHLCFVYPKTDRVCVCESDAGEFRSWRKRWISVVMQKG